MSESPALRTGRSTRDGVRERLQQPRVRLAIAVLVACLVGVVLWLTVGSGGGSSSAQPPVRPIRISAAGLRTLAKVLPYPIYWAGRQPGTTYELSRGANGDIDIRYLPAGVQIGSRHPYLAIGTYPLANAYAITRRAAERSGAVSVPAGAGTVAFYDRSRPTNVYLARSGSNFQIEVFDPSAGRARDLVQSGRIAPVPGRVSPGGGPRAVSAAALSRFAASVGHPVYWLGPRPGSTYELTQIPNGAITVRYLPAGAKPGAAKPYLTVATYPFPHAYETLKALARTHAARTISVPGGGIALLDAQAPTNVHLAFPRSDYQIEVFDPTAGRASQIASSGQVVPVG